MILRLNLGTSRGRFNAALGRLVEALKSNTRSKVAPWLLVGVIALLVVRNARGNIPRNYTPTQFYSAVMTLRVVL